MTTSRTTDTAPSSRPAPPMALLGLMFDAHPKPASQAGDEAVAAAIAALECGLVCEGCADACLSEADIPPLRPCIRLSQHCAEVCFTTARLLARAGRQDVQALERGLRDCAEICRACAEMCAGHAARMSHCGICAEACRRCAEACERMVPALVP